MLAGSSPTTDPFASLPNWLELCNLSDEELGKYDIAVVNLACAVGLPGSEVIDVPGCLKALDDWAKGIRWQTEYRIETEFRADPAKYESSEPLYRMVKLVSALQQHCGVQYDPAKKDAKPEDPFDHHEHFIYGPIQGPGGTCATLPILYTAIGRRLGYPLRLVTAPRHMFCRWDDPDKGIRLNIDGACEKGLSAHPDDYYRKGRVPFTADQERMGGYLRSLTPREELAQFVGRRGTHWWELGNYRRAASAFILAGRIDATRLGWLANLRQLEEEWVRELHERLPPGCPKIEIQLVRERRRWPGLAWEIEQRLRYFEAVENVFNDRNLEEQCWEPMRAGRQPRVALPEKIVVDCTGEELCSIHP